MPAKKIPLQSTVHSLTPFGAYARATERADAALKSSSALSAPAKTLSASSPPRPAPKQRSVSEFRSANQLLKEADKKYPPKKFKY